MKKLYIHIGTEKTGTTSIQQFFFENQKVLKDDHDIYYPLYNCSQKAQFELAASLHPMCHDGRTAEFIAKPVGEPLEVWKQFCEHLKEVNANTVFISAEHFSSRISRDGISFIKKIISEELPNYEISILVYIRPQYEMLCSSYSTYIKSGGGLTLDEVFNQVNLKGFYYNYNNLIRQWGDIFGKENIIVRKYTHDVLSDCLELFNIPFDKSSIQNKQNLSWNPVFLEFARLLNNSTLKDSQHGARYRSLVELLNNTNEFKKFDGLRIGSKDYQDEFNDLFERENGLLSKYINDSSIPNFLTSNKDYDNYYDISNFSRDICQILYQVKLESV